MQVLCSWANIVFFQVTQIMKVDSRGLTIFFTDYRRTDPGFFKAETTAKRNYSNKWTFQDWPLLPSCAPRRIPAKAHALHVAQYFWCMTWPIIIWVLGVLRRFISCRSFSIELHENRIIRNEVAVPRKVEWSVISRLNPDTGLKGLTTIIEVLTRDSQRTSQIP
jgi:hypothetical protein